MSSAIAVIAGAVAIFLTWRDKAPKLAALLALAAGAGITAGVIGRMLHQAVAVASDLTGRATSTAVGTAVPAVLAIVAVLWFGHDMWPKHPANRITAALGFVVPVLAASVPGAAGSVVTSAVHTLTASMASAVGAIFGS